MEDKQKICDALAVTLRLTRNHHDLVRLVYSPVEGGTLEYVTAYWQGGHNRTINVTLDSGTAMIRDIIRAID